MSFLSSQNTFEGKEVAEKNHRLERRALLVHCPCWADLVSLISHEFLIRKRFYQKRLQLVKTICFSTNIDFLT